MAGRVWLHAAAELMMRIQDSAVTPELSVYLGTCGILTLDGAAVLQQSVALGQQRHPSLLLTGTIIKSATQEHLTDGAPITKIL